VEEKDARVAEEIMMFALFKEVRKPKRHVKRKMNNGAAGRGAEESGTASEESEASEAEEQIARMVSPRVDVQVSAKVPLPFGDTQDASGIDESQIQDRVAPER